jgi:hypothetical protein
MGRSRPQVSADLGYLAELAGTWEGFGFNLIGRPDKQGGSPVFLELNQTFETLSFTRSHRRFRTAASPSMTSSFSA